MHVTQLSDCAAVGLSFPHGAFDGIGMGQILSALRAELAGQPWDAPALPPSPLNVLDQAERVKLPCRGDPAAGRRQLRDFTVATALAFTWMVWTLVWEKVWGKAEMRVLWLGGDVVQGLVGRVKKEAEAESDGGWVSTGDVLLAWMLKASLSNEASSSKTLASSTVFEKRSLLGIPSYPHNATGILPFPLVPLSTLAATSLSTLSLLHRSSLTLHRTLPCIASLSSYVRTLPLGSTLAFARPKDHVSFVFTNQTAAGFGRMRFAGMGEVREVVVLQSPFTPDHSVQINGLPGGGYMLGGSLRRTRWEAVEREARRLVEEGEANEKSGW